MGSRLTYPIREINRACFCLTFITHTEGCASCFDDKFRQCEVCFTRRSSGSHSFILDREDIGDVHCLSAVPFGKVTHAMLVSPSACKCNASSLFPLRFFPPLSKLISCCSTVTVQVPFRKRDEFAEDGNRVENPQKNSTPLIFCSGRHKALWKQGFMQTAFLGSSLHCSRAEEQKKTHRYCKMLCDCNRRWYFHVQTCPHGSKNKWQSYCVSEELSGRQWWPRRT